MFYIGEYGHMMVASGLFATFYLGGYDIPWVSNQQLLTNLTSSFGATGGSILTALIYLVSFLVKVGFLLWVFVWVRWTLPRFRYDQLMDLGWKSMLPWALFNTVLTAIWLVVMHG